MSTAYSVNVYITPGELALRLTRFTRADILAGNGPRIHCSFIRQQRRSSFTDATAGRKQKQPAQTNLNGADVTRNEMEVDDTRVPGAAGPSRLPRAKKKRLYEYVDASEEDEKEVIGELVDDIDDGGEDFTNAMRVIDEAPSSDAESSEDGDGHWQYSLRPPRTSKKRKVCLPPKGPSSSKQMVDRVFDDEVISLSSD